MATIELSIDLNKREISELVGALAKFQRVTQRDMKTAIRIATIDLCKSLRKRTSQSPKLMPKSAFRFGKRDPQWWTASNGELKRRMVRKRFGKPDLVFFQPCAIKYRSRRTKSGGLIESWTKQSEAKLINDARRQRGHIRNWGLAKQSWGWFMWRLFNVAEKGFANPRVNLTHRHVQGGIVESREPLLDGTIDVNAPLHYQVTIINRIRYIRRALADGAISEAVKAATQSLIYKAENSLKSKRLG